MVVTTSRLQRMPRKARLISSRTHETTWASIGWAKSIEFCDNISVFSKVEQSHTGIC